MSKCQLWKKCEMKQCESFEQAMVTKHQKIEISACVGTKIGRNKPNNLSNKS